MIKYKLLLFFLMTLFALVAKSEVIDGPANFRLKPNGQILFSLKDGQAVECGELKNGWFEVFFTIKITKQQYDKNYEVRKGEKLYDEKGKLLGVALANIPFTVTRPESYGGIKSAAVYDMQIWGYVSKLNIKTNSIPENSLDSVFKSKSKYLQYDTLKSFLVHERYRKMDLIQKTLPQFTEYCIYESTVVDESPGYRIGLIFENNELIAVEHSRSLSMVKSKEYVILHRNKLFIVKPPTGLSVSAFVKKVNEANVGAD